jgi:hypothetical protein
VSVIVASRRLLRARKFKIQRRVARLYHPVQRASACPLFVGSRRATTRTSTTTMVQLANHRRVDSETSSLAAATARDHRPVPWHGRQLALMPVPVEWRASAAPHALASTTARTSERCCRRRPPRHYGASSPVPAQLRPQSPPQQSIPPHQPPLRPRPSPPQRLPRHPDNTPQRRRRPTSTVTSA